MQFRESAQSLLSLTADVIVVFPARIAIDAIKLSLMSVCSTLMYFVLSIFYIRDLHKYVYSVELFLVNLRLPVSISKRGLDDLPARRNCMDLRFHLSRMKRCALNTSAWIHRLGADLRSSWNLANSIDMYSVIIICK